MESEKDKPTGKVDFDTDLHGEVQTDSTGKNILIRDPDATIDTSELEILEYSPPDAGDQNKLADASREENQHDPYNSGCFDMTDSGLAESQDESAGSREWKSKSSK